MNLNNFTDGRFDIKIDQADIISTDIEVNNYIFNEKEFGFDEKNIKNYVENLKNGKFVKISDKIALNLKKKSTDNKAIKINKFNVDLINKTFKINLLKFLNFIMGFLPGVCLLNAIIIWFSDFVSYSRICLRIFYFIYLGLISSLLYYLNYYLISERYFKNEIINDENKNIKKKIKIKIILHFIAYCLIILQKFFIWKVSTNPADTQNNVTSSFILKTTSVLQTVLIIITWFLNINAEIQKLNAYELKN